MSKYYIKKMQRFVVKSFSFMALFDNSLFKFFEVRRDI